MDFSHPSEIVKPLQPNEISPLRDSRGILFTMKIFQSPCSLQPLTRRHGWSTAPGLAVLLLVAAFSPNAAFTQVTNTTPLTTYSSSPPGNFGIALAALGNDRVIIGASADSTGASGAGAARLFNTNGTLLTTITNPAPASSDAVAISEPAAGVGRA